MIQKFLGTSELSVLAIPAFQEKFDEKLGYSENILQRYGHCESKKQSFAETTGTGWDNPSFAHWNSFDNWRNRGENYRPLLRVSYHA